MRTLIKRLITTVAAMALIAAPQAMVMSTVHAQDAVTDSISEAACDGANLSEGASCDTGESQDNFNTLMKRIINIFSIVVGAISVIMIIIGGFRYIISGGDSNNVTGAKNTILYALVGLVIVLFSQIIVRFVLSNATSTQ